MGVMKDDELDEERSLLTRARRLRSLPKRVSQLEEDMIEARELHVRVAELVAELLVPLAKLDPEKAVEILERYQDELGS